VPLFSNQTADKTSDQDTDRISEAEFFQHSWRKQPYFFRGACQANLKTLVNATREDQLLALAENDLVESRMVSLDYELALGPFTLETIPEHHLLMIQGLDQHLGEVNQLLLDEFPFLPRWRIEDVMVTIGNAGANCGAHFDHYDVFLVQVRGSKDWQLDTGGHTEQELDHDAEIRLLQNFECSRRHLAEPGDVLYIPPGVGHLGIASGQSVTLSVGIRNPTMPELISHLADMLVDSTDLTARLDDGLQSATGGITNVDIQNLRAKLAETILNPDLIAHWYGHYMTELREPELITDENSLTTGEISSLISGRAQIACTLPTRLTYFESENVLTVFVNGDVINTNPAVLGWLRPLCSHRQVTGSQISNEHYNIDLLKTLFDNGALEVVNQENAEKYE
jgi:50S ribosomal protein L16 3-hydroxylase